MSLYNDERPRLFSQVLGQEVVVKQMKRKLAEGRFPQTVLATGPRGTGKTTCARIIAKALNCENLTPEGEPCCTCPSCKAVEGGVSPSVIEMDAATNNGVEDVRALVEKAGFVPVGKKLVFILDEVHMFSTAAWNALLKTLEEPPKDVVFILATTELHKVPVTVLSRCLRFEFQKISRQVMEDYIFELCKKYEIGIEPGALSLIVTQAEGCMRDALSLLEQFIGCEVLETETVLDFLGLASEDVIFDILMGMSKGDAKASIDVIEDCEKRGKSLLAIVKSILEALTVAAGYKAGKLLPPQSEEYKSKLVAFSDSVTESKLNQLTGTFLQVYPMLQKNSSLAFLLKAAIVNVVSSESLLGRLEEEVNELKKRPVAAVVETAVPVVNVSNTTVEVADVQSVEQEKVVPFPAVAETATAVGAEDYSSNIPVVGASDFEEVPDWAMIPFDEMEPSFTVSKEQNTAVEDNTVVEAVQTTVEPSDVTENVSDAEELVDGRAMSFDEMMASMLGGNTDSGGNDEESTIDKTEEEGEESEKAQEESPAAVEQEPDFSAFSFFMAGGLARL